MATAPASATSTSGLDVNSIVSQLMQVERQPLQAMQAKQSALQAKISAFGALKNTYAAIGDAAAKLAVSGAFKTVAATSSDTSAVGVTAGAGAGVTAAPGTYSIEVTALAQAQKLTSAAFAAPDGTAGSGTLQIQMGAFAAGVFTPNPDKAALTVTIGPGQSTWAGVRDAINATGAGVRASIIHDGNGYRLALASTDSGSANSLRITVADDDANPLDNAGLSQLAYDPAGGAGTGKNLVQTSAARDATLTIDGISVVKPSNTVSDAISGVTLNLAKLTAGTPVTVSITPDASAAKSALDALVANFNSFQTSVKSLTGFNPQTKTGGLLPGDASARSLLEDLKTALTRALPGLAGQPSSLSQIGLTFQKNGMLALDAAVFNKAFANPAANLASLFGATGVSSDARVQFAAATDATAAGSYAVNVTQAASRGTLAASAAANLVISAGVNDVLGLAVNGVNASVTLAAGTYTADALTAELQSRINGAAALRSAGLSVIASHSGGVLSLTSATWGSASSVTAASGNAAAGLFGLAPQAASGANIAGTLGGAAATGSGRTLKTSSGLAVTVQTAAAGAFGSVNFNRGYASRLSSVIAGALNTSGAFASRSDGLTRSVKDNQQQQERFNDRLIRIESGLRKQYTALDGMLASMNTTSTYLAQQLAALQAQRAA